MRFTERLVAISQLVLIFPALLVMGSLLVRNLSLLSNEPARTAQQIVTWYSGRMWTLWILHPERYEDGGPWKDLRRTGWSG
jgi:hypothetical protein